VTVEIKMTLNSNETYSFELANPVSNSRLGYDHKSWEGPPLFNDGPKKCYDLDSLALSWYQLPCPRIKQGVTHQSHLVGEDTVL
jgi:hypothetical protein